MSVRGVSWRGRNAIFWTKVFVGEWFRTESVHTNNRIRTFRYRNMHIGALEGTMYHKKQKQSTPRFEPELCFSIYESRGQSERMIRSRPGEGDRDGVVNIIFWGCRDLKGRTSTDHSLPRWRKQRFEFWFRDFRKSCLNTWLSFRKISETRVLTCSHRHRLFWTNFWAFLELTYGTASLRNWR